MKNKKIVLCGVAGEEKNITKWLEYFTSHGYNIIAYPKKIITTKEKFLTCFKGVHITFYKAIAKTNYLYIINDTSKNNQFHYIGAGVFAEISFAMNLNLIKQTNIKIIINNMPDKNNIFYEDILRWSDLKWLEVINKY